MFISWVLIVGTYYKWLRFQYYSSNQEYGKSYYMIRYIGFSNLVCSQSVVLKGAVFQTQISIFCKIFSAYHCHQCFIKQRYLKKRFEYLPQLVLVRTIFKLLIPKNSTKDESSIHFYFHM